MVPSSIATSPASVCWPMKLPRSSDCFSTRTGSLYTARVPGTRKPLPDICDPLEHRDRIGRNLASRASGFEVAHQDRADIIVRYPCNQSTVAP